MTHTETPRRYSESEISAILKEAAHDQEAARAEAHHDGLTLAELKKAGQAAGIAPKSIARAAASVGANASTPSPKVRLGQRVSVAHAVEVPGPFTDADWDALVQDLRHTFSAQGTVSQSSASRHWHNGNLRVYVEAAPGGHCINFYTLHGVLQSRLDASLILAITSLFAVAVLLAGETGVLLALATGGAIGLGAAGLYGFSAYQLPRWRHTRKEQMKAIAGRMLDRAAAREEGRAGTSSSESSSDARLEDPADSASSIDAQRTRPSQRTT